MRTVNVAFVVLTVGAAAGCSGVPPMKYASQVDVEKVGLINAVARQRGVDVVWINPPRKPAVAGKSAKLAIE